MSTSKPINPMPYIVLFLTILFVLWTYTTWQQHKDDTDRTQAVTQAVKAIPTTCPNTQQEAIDLLTPTAKALGLNAGTLGVLDPPRAKYGVLIEGDHKTILALQAAIYNAGSNCIHRADWGNNTGKTVMTISFDAPAYPAIDPSCPSGDVDCLKDSHAPRREPQG